MGHLFVAAAGNSGRSIADGRLACSWSPLCSLRHLLPLCVPTGGRGSPRVWVFRLSSCEVLCVAATDQDDRLTSFSNYASEYVATRCAAKASWLGGDCCPGHRHLQQLSGVSQLGA